MGHRVLAVEMMPRNVQHLQTALQISGLGSKVTIVNNALYSDHRSFEVQFLDGNIGGTRVNDSQTSKIHLNPSSVQTICLDDLTPILAGSKAYVKMDIENTEHQALQCATIFFSEVDIQVVQMEWMDREMQASEQILDFMDAYGYIISKDPNLHEPVHITSIPKDIFFIKKPPTF
ncbi:hypothetical protein Bpfe_026542 [Biomphalaria pfeifferi]|uniref:Methyltransferase FkbM domain-containing protein n=1 Tax=Biomphalaria pfeifferi TaxID=112525 RepID=A0AAD8EYG7_BIOPF|nr:hypothetical protein Bpfe_026542 [Biomphalaria pfeifferi]